MFQFTVEIRSNSASNTHTEGKLTGQRQQAHKPAHQYTFRVSAERCVGTNIILRLPAEMVAQVRGRVLTKN